MVFLIGGFYLLNTVISRFSGSSTILTADRYSNFSNDTSLTARLTLGRYLTNPLQYLIGNPDAPSIDNLYIDVMVRYGLLPALALVVLMVVALIRSISMLRQRQNETAALCVWFIVVQSLFGNVFNAPVGVLIGVILGTVMAQRRKDPAPSTEETGSSSSNALSAAFAR